MKTKINILNLLRIAICLMVLLHTNGNAFAFAVSIHPEITNTALPFIRPLVMEDINDENDYEDVNFSTEPDHHFDGCEFSGATDKINNNLTDARIDADPQAFDSGDLADKWGQAIHTSEDFYAHSNWVNTGKTTLIDGGLGFRTTLTPYSIHDGAMIVQGEDQHPFGADSWLSLNPNNKTVNVFTGSTPPAGVAANVNIPGIVTGYWWVNQSDDCPDSVEISHGDLNKDTPDIPLHNEARELATQQIRHEWCRLLNISNNKYGIAGPAALLGLWVSPNGNPHPQGTLCQSEAPGPVEITVSINKIHVLDDKDSNASGELNFVSLMFTSDFKQSDRNEIAHSLSIEDSPAEGYSDVPANELPGSVQLCVNSTDTVAVSLQAWDDDGASDGEFENPTNIDEGDEPLDGATLSLTGPNFTTGTQNASSDDLEVTFNISTNTTDSDNDGLSDCAEKSIGTLPNNPDTDNDGLTDGAEVNTYGTYPLVADTDNDGLTDGAEVNTYGTYPLVADSDNDGLIDGAEVNGSNPTKPMDADTDKDGLLDGIEDSNHNGALDSGETNPNNPDSDQDILTDGCEVKGSNPTNPLLADTDNDGLSDGIEDVNHNCALDLNETNPNDSDSDDDGIPDGEDVEWIQGSINNLPSSAFKGTGDRIAFLNELDSIEAKVAKGQLDQALTKLITLRTRVDGCGTFADGNDWIVDCASQIKIRGYLDLLIKNLTN